MSDNAFKTAPYSAYTTVELARAATAPHLSTEERIRMLDEIVRREGALDNASSDQDFARNCHMHKEAARSAYELTCDIGMKDSAKYMAYATVEFNYWSACEEAAFRNAQYEMASAGAFSRARDV